MYLPQYHYTLNLSKGGLDTTIQYQVYQGGLDTTIQYQVYQYLDGRYVTFSGYSVSFANNTLIAMI
jgi:hypothetical protein